MKGLSNVWFKRIQNRFLNRITNYGRAYQCRIWEFIIHSFHTVSQIQLTVWSLKMRSKLRHHKRWMPTYESTIQQRTKTRVRSCSKSIWFVKHNFFLIVVVARDERETESGQRREQNKGRDESRAEDETRTEQRTRREQNRGRDESRAEEAAAIAEAEPKPEADAETEEERRGSRANRQSSVQWTWNARAEIRWRSALLYRKRATPSECAWWLSPRARSERRTSSASNSAHWRCSRAQLHKSRPWTTPLTRRTASARRIWMRRVTEVAYIMINPFNILVHVQYMMCNVQSVLNPGIQACIQFCLK